jgi:hypothetical protein
VHAALPRRALSGQRLPCEGGGEARVVVEVSLDLGQLAAFAVA